MSSPSDYATLPPELSTILGGETQDFMIKAQKAYPSGQSMGMIGFGLFWTLFISVFWIAFFGPLFTGHEVHFKSNGVPVTAGPENMGPLLVPGLIIVIFTIIGITMLAGGFKMLGAPGPWFVATPTRLLVWTPNQLRTINWEDFDGNLSVDGGRDNGTITIEMRSGHMVSQKNAPDRYVPDKIYIVGVPNALALEELCRKRINEHNK